MLALSQAQSFDVCKPIPSITNLISPSCTDDLKPAAITDTDLSFLKALYAVDPGINFQAQKSFIADRMASSFGIK